MEKSAEQNRDDLWAFVWRADTPEKIAIAEKWLTEHVKDNNLWENLMSALSDQSRIFYRKKGGRTLI